MKRTAHKPPENRCLKLLGLATVIAILLWLLACLLIAAIYHGHAGDYLNSLITGQSVHTPGNYIADFSRPYLLACAAVLAPLLVCSLLPATVRRQLHALSVGLFGTARTTLGREMRLSTVQLVVIVAGIFLFTALFNPWQSTGVHVPDSYALGKSSLLSGPDDCNGELCYQIEINCPELGRTGKAALRVGLPAAGVDEKGTILFFSGWVGDLWWDWHGTGDETTGPEERQAEYRHKRILANLQAAGFRTVQVKWEKGWFVASPGKQENPPLLACTPATLSDWINRELHSPAPERAFCAVGHSNGATELGYMLSRYNQGDIFDLVAMESGPNWARLDYSCIREPAFPELFNTRNGRSTIDLAFGYPNDGSGICAREDVSQLELFRRTGIVSDYAWSYHYPDTMIAIMVSEDDPSVGRRHAELYHDRLLKSGTPLLRFDVLPGENHLPSSTPAGAELLENILLNECHPRREIPAVSATD